MSHQNALFVSNTIRNIFKSNLSLETALRPVKDHVLVAKRGITGIIRFVLSCLLHYDDDKRGNFQFET